MYLQDYLFFLIPIILCALLSGYASNRVKTTFTKYDKTKCRSGCTGYDTVSRLMRSNGVNGISIGKVNGFLSDHYHPTKRIVNLSDSTYNSSSIAAVAVAAHEMGHVMQKEDGYSLFKLRTAIVPVVNWGTKLATPLVFIGLLLDLYSLTANEDLGFKIAMLGVILYGGSLLFALVTLPVELNASRRAAKMLTENSILTQDELPAARKVLSAAAFTYLASLITSIVYFLRFLLRVLTMFGRRSNRR